MTLIPSFVYTQDICARDVGLIVNAAKLDSLTGNNANFLFVEQVLDIMLVQVD